LNVSDEGGADSREQTSLWMRSTLCSEREGLQKCTKIEVVLRSSIVLHRLSFVYGVEIELGVVVLDA